MTIFYIKVAIYLLCLSLSMFGLNALDFNKLLKQGRTTQAQFLYVILACIMTYLLGSFFISLIYYLN